MKAALSFHPIAGDYDFIGEFREGRALVRNNIAEFRVGYIDKEGRVAVPLEYIGRFEREAGHPVFVHFPFFSDGLAVLMRKDGRFGAVDPSGGMAVPVYIRLPDVFLRRVGGGPERWKVGLSRQRGARGHSVAV